MDLYETLRTPRKAKARVLGPEIEAAAVM